MKPYFLLSLCCFGSFIAHAQHFYLKAGTGYAFAMPATDLGESTVSRDHLITDPETGYYVPEKMSDVRQQVTGSYGAGIVSTVVVGYQFSSALGVELGLGYQSGKTYRFADEYHETLDGEPRRDRVETTKREGRNLYASPAIVFTSAGEKFVPYLTAGMMIALPSVLEQYHGYNTFSAVPVDEIREVEYRQGVTFGLKGGAGIDYHIGRNVALFLEATFTSLDYGPRRRETVKLERNGEDLLPSLSQRQRYARLGKEVRTTHPEASGYATELGRSFAFSAVNTLAGVKIAF